jgi:hypothetical protein
MQSVTLKSFYGTMQEGAAYMREYKRHNPELKHNIDATAVFQFNLSDDD